MKNITTHITMVVTFLVIGAFNVSLARTDVTEKKQPVPEVIACEQQRSCKMTTIDDLLQQTEKKEAAKSH